MHTSVLFTLETKIISRKLDFQKSHFFLFMFLPAISKIWNPSILQVNYFGKSIKNSMKRFLAKNIMESWAI